MHRESIELPFWGIIAITTRYTLVSLAMSSNELCTHHREGARPSDWQAWRGKEVVRVGTGGGLVGVSVLM